MAKKNKSNLYGATWVLLLIGGLNWGLVGLFGFDFIEALLGSITMLQQVVYVLIGLSAVYLGYKHNPFKK